MKISRLRLLGFKSFVEPTELVIERGLTGVVGPNGCGKSNLLEALRWVMGETSHKSMRAAAMDDVIFSGTTLRPQRNTAEVTIFIDNSERLAPAEWNGSDTIEITRRIEREAGSAYRINGREARARDIKILFEDAATGARSPALVRQGQIGEIVNAKPEARRRVLEDAAGIAGLHSRRHEAELRLKAAEGNLARLNDVLGGLNGQIESLKRQARAARRYKEVSDEIRRQEALYFHLGWSQAQADVDAGEASLGEALERLAVVTQAEAKAVSDEAELAEALPPLREIEAKRGALVGRLRIESETFEREAERAAARQRELAGRIEQLARDVAREENFITEAREIIARLDAELSELGEAESRSEGAEAQAQSALVDAERSLSVAEAALADVTHRAAEARARRRGIEAARAERVEAAEKIQRRLAALESQMREIAARAPDASKLSETSETGQRLAREIASIEAETIAAEARVRELADLVKTKRDAATAARLAVNAITTERETLAKLLVAPRESDIPPVVDQLRVEPGYEAALAAALGDDIDAPVGEDGPVHWRMLDVATDDASLPAEAELLATHVESPPELRRRLRQIGVIARALGPRLQAHLKPGQRLVSREGDLWRWDGFVAASEGTTVAAQRLAERNRLSVIEFEEAEARDAADLLADAERAAGDALLEAEANERHLRQSWREKQMALARARDALTGLERAARETESRVAAVTDARWRAEEELGEVRQRLASIEEELAALGSLEALEHELTAAQGEAQRQRTQAAEARAVATALGRERKARAERLEAAEAERQRWAARTDGAQAQISSLKGRIGESETELAPLAELPVEIERRRQQLMSQLAAAETQRREAADTLAAADNKLRSAQQAMRAAQLVVSEAREARARSEARLESSRLKRQEEARRIRDAFAVAPDECLALAGVVPGAALPAYADVERQLVKLRADRERLGGVNLQADDDLARLSEEFEVVDRERADVEQAVAKLRGAIGQLNREGRKRLQEAFDTVNGHFQRLFTTLFTGGEARLEMIESQEDPLEGGLEIIARPPGKKPATLSLLSGGEQTLTALALIFAVFLTNPSPICVLDEVDAPLDDANVDRFCTLMERMAADTATRFLVITHHPMTMARMNRLFGVTMQEKGVSQLVSVDLETAQMFREAS